ncbi:MAG: hypothetical protein R6W96_01025 [Clostridia bacterium]
MRLLFDEETIISMAGPGIQGWGPWQFPRVFQNDNILYVEIHTGQDSARDYGKSKSWYRSHDMGKTWQRTQEQGGVMLDDKSLINTHAPLSRDLSDVILPGRIGTRMNYGLEASLYRMDETREEYREWTVMRRSSRGAAWEIQRVVLDDRLLVLAATEGVLAGKFFHQLVRAPDGAVWAPLYETLHDNGIPSAHCHAVFFKSIDNGKSFYMESLIPYAPPYPADPLSKKRFGFTEPCLCFTGGDSVFTLLRTTDGNGIGPLYISRSRDNGQSWSAPEIFDDRGVWPQAVHLGNGATVAGYGRPGLFIRIMHGDAWQERIALVHPEEYQTETCSYCALQALTKDSFLAVYSKFKHRDARGITGKAILARRITVEV